MSFNAKELPTVLTAQEIIDKAYRRASKVGGRTSKERALNKLATISNVLRDYFKKVVDAHPSYDNLPPFYREMIDVVVGVRRIKKCLAAISWADRMTQRVISKGVAQIKGGKDPKIVLREVYGRVASIVEQIDEELKFLNEAREKLKEIPTLSEDFTVVLAGYPNVGKSSIIAEISSVKPEIASYPFTTKKISVGFVEDKDIRIQVIDTPGILDRPISKRNEIEKRAIVALKHLADLIVFVIDPTETCGYSLENQLNLLREVKETFKKPTIEIYSKADLHDFKDRMRISVVTKEGIDELLSLIKEEARKSKSR